MDIATGVLLLLVPSLSLTLMNLGEGGVAVAFLVVATIFVSAVLFFLGRAKRMEVSM